MKKKSWIEILIEDEKRSVSEYSELADVLTSMGYSELSNLAKEIAKDEEKHIRILKKIERSIL